MLINLQKSFCFTSEKDTYQVGYVFRKEFVDSNANESSISLLITYSKNHEEEVTNKIANASSIFFQSNEQIRKLVEEKILSPVYEWHRQNMCAVKA